MIGILGLQGDYAAHGRMLEQLETEWRVVKKPSELDGVDGLIIPGGESSTLIKLMDSWGFWGALSAFARQGRGVLGTCAGMILVAREVLNPPQRSLGLIDIVVERNSYGRQVDSFEAFGEIQDGEDTKPLEMVFIRAPRIVGLGPGVERLATCRGDYVLVRQGAVMAASFHPELTSNLTVHQLFVRHLVARHPGHLCL